MRTFLRMRKDIDDATWFDTALRYAAPYGLEPGDKPVLIISWYHDIPAKKPYNPDSLEGCC